MLHSTSEYLQQLQNDKATLVDNLTTMGVTASDDETFTELVPKVLDISSGGDITITDASYLFYNGARLNSLNELLSACKNVTRCQSMFYNCYDLTSLDLSSFDTSNVTDMNNMFNNCTNLTSLDLSNFDTSGVTNMARMFYFCRNLTSLDLSSFDTSNVTNTSYVLYACNLLEKLIINRQDVFKMTNANMLQSTPIEDGTGYVYVPDNMVETYKSATNWSVYADQIKPISELPMEEV